MKGKQFLTGFVMLALTAGGGAMASEIYKWTDEDGNVHYEDRPSGAATEQRLALTYRRSSSGSVERQVKSLADSQAARQEARAAADAEAQQAEELKAEAEAKKARCEKHRAQLETLLQARRLYRQGENGEREYLDDKQRQEARSRTEELIAKNCTS